MPTTTTTHLCPTPVRPMFRHFPVCDTRATGLVVQQLLADSEVVTITRDSLDRTVALSRAVGLKCDCVTLRLTHVESRLRSVWKSQKAWAQDHPREEMHAETIEHSVTQLTAQRDWLRTLGRGCVMGPLTTRRP